MRAVVNLVSVIAGCRLAAENDGRLARAARKDRHLMRYLIALGTAILIVAMTWPYLRRYMPRRQQPGGRPSRRARAS